MPSVQSTPDAQWAVRGGTIRLDHPIVVGILNVTPDSFSDGGRFTTVGRALRHVELMVAEGADIVDIGGESTRPQGATTVAVSEEMNRVIPVLRAVRSRFGDVPLSVDTSKSAVATAAFDEGANIINDVSGFRLDPRTREIAARVAAGVILMHSRGSVEEMGTYKHAQYGSDITSDVVAELANVIEMTQNAGVRREAIVVDPGIGFAKRSRHSVELLGSLSRVRELGYPVMVGVSRKRFIGELSHVSTPSKRVAGTVGANVAALMSGARLFRVHDVAPNRQALDVAWAILHPLLGQRPGAGNGGEGDRSPFPGPRSQS